MKRVACTRRNQAPTIVCMLKFLLLGAMLTGLLMFLLSKKNPDVKRIGEILLFSSILALLIALAPGTVTLLHG